MSEDDLLRMAASLGWPMLRERARVILPEVQRLLDAAARLRDLPIEPDMPPRDLT
jgi:hypothetical protein